MDDLQKKQGTSFILLQALCSISYPLVNSNWSYSPETPNLGHIWQFLEPCDLEIWHMTLQNNRAPLLCYFKLCASFHTPWWIQIWVTIRKRSIRVKIDDFFSRVSQKVYGWPSKTIGHLYYATSSFVYHFVPIGESKLELQSGNAQFGSNWTIFRTVRPWNLMNDLEKQTGPLLCYFKLCTTFRTHWWIQTGVTVRKRPIWVKFDDFESRATMKFDGWPCKTIGHLFYATSNFVYHFIPIGEFNLELQSGNAQFGSKSTIFLAVWPRNFTDDTQKQ